MPILYILFLLCLGVCAPVFASEHHHFDAAPLQLATPYSEGIQLDDYFVSEKLDGVRARWTGNVLLTRNGNRIYAPDWFTANWPNMPLDGELWTSRRDFQRIASIVLSDTPDERWRDVKMMIFDTPLSDTPFVKRIKVMSAAVEQANSDSLQMIAQFRIASLKALDSKLDDIVRAGGEGLMLHHQQAFYQDGRSHLLMKLKRFEDDEAKVIGYVPGKGKYAGLTGSLIVESREGTVFKIGSGLSNEDRANPPAMGSWVTFKYYGKTRAGLPRFASFLHVRPEADRPQ